VIFERVKSEGIAHISYFIGSGNSAAVIDPRRDCQIYVELAQKHGLKINHIFETHRNEDYTIGSAELKNMTGAEIYHGRGLDWKYGNTIDDGREVRIGKLRITVIATPGHTDESMSYVLADMSSGNAPIMVFTGDTLFVGDVGRTDFGGPDDAQRMASNQYDSIFNKILPLGDGVLLCPAHGAGSVCGSHIADRDESTLGIERLQNPMLQMSKDDFIKFKKEQKLEMPSYFRQMEKYNIEGAPLLGCLPIPMPLTPDEFKAEIGRGAVVVDTSYPASFSSAHIHDSYSIWLGGLSVFAGWVLPYDKPILLVLEDQSHLERAVRYLVRVGYDNIIGYLKDGMRSWSNAGFDTEHLNLLTVQELKTKLDKNETLNVVDARTSEEWGSGHIKGSRNIYVGHIPAEMGDLSWQRQVVILCNVGFRASLGASVLLREGCRKVYNVLGGMTAWKAAGYPMVKD
jgi:hydroxyacylglutathione hydrolase